MRAVLLHLSSRPAAGRRGQPQHSRRRGRASRRRRTRPTWHPVEHQLSQHHDGIETVLLHVASMRAQQAAVRQVTKPPARGEASRGRQERGTRQSVGSSWAAQVGTAGGWAQLWAPRGRRWLPLLLRCSSQNRIGWLPKTADAAARTRQESWAQARPRSRSRLPASSAGQAQRAQQWAKWVGRMMQARAGGRSTA